MPAAPRTPLRTRSAGIAFGAAAVAAAGAAFLADPIGAPVAAAAGVAVAGAGAFAVWAGLGGLARAAAAGRDVAEGKLDPTALTAEGELADLAAAVKAVEDRRAKLEATYRNDLETLAATLLAALDPKTAGVAPTLAAPFPPVTAKVRAGFDELGKELAGVRQRFASAIRILNGLPDAVVVVDQTGAPKYLNAAAEAALGVTTAAVGKRTLAALIADPAEQTLATADPGRPVAGPNELTEWLHAGGTAPLLVRTGAGHLIELSAAVGRKGSKDGLTYLVGRDAIPALTREADDRAITRAETTRQILDRYLAETEEPFAALAAQLRLLAGDAKQSGQRDAMMAKLTAATAGLNKAEAFQTLAHWFRASVWSGLPAPTPAEFVAGEVVGQVAAKLAGRFKARGNTLKVTDQGGWLYADPDRLTAALTGLLVHACDATSNLPVELRISRVPASADCPTPLTEFHLPDAGLVPTAFDTLIDRPFDGPAGADQFAATEGCPFGLVVAARLADAMGGQLRVESDASGRLGLRLTVPTRLAGGEPPVTVAAAAPGALEVAPVEELVSGWRLGTPAA